MKSIFLVNNCTRARSVLSTFLHDQKAIWKRNGKLVFSQIYFCYWSQFHNMQQNLQTLCLTCPSFLSKKLHLLFHLTDKEVVTFNKNARFDGQWFFAPFSFSLRKPGSGSFVFPPNAHCAFSYQPITTNCLNTYTC